jgi:hypothetical protein
MGFPQSRVVPPRLQPPIVPRFPVGTREQRHLVEQSPVALLPPGRYLGHPARRRCGPVSRGHPQPAPRPPPPAPNPAQPLRGKFCAARSPPPAAGVTRGHCAAPPRIPTGAGPETAPRDGATEDRKMGREVGRNEHPSSVFLQALLKFSVFKRNKTRAPTPSYAAPGTAARVSSGERKETVGRTPRSNKAPRPEGSNSTTDPFGTLATRVLWKQGHAAPVLGALSRFPRSQSNRDQVL